MANLDQIIRKPLMTEKGTLESEKNNRYGFIVDIKANKYQIKDAVEKLFDVRVEKVWTNITPGKMKRAGRKVKKASPLKKAYVQVGQGQKIEFFKGV